MIEKLLTEIKDAVSMVSTETAQIMSESMEATLLASKFEQKTRLTRFLRLLKCASESKQKEMMCNFATSLFAADYYFSTGWANKAIPHLELAVALFQEQYGGPLLSEDKDAIVQAFRSQNLKSKFSREFNAVRNIYMLSGAAQKLGLALPLDELPADLVPNSTHAIDMVQILLFSVMAAWFIMCGLDDYQTSRFTDNPMPLSEAVQGFDILAIIAGLALFVWNIAWIFLQYSPRCNRLRGRFHFWKFKRLH